MSLPKMTLENVGDGDLAEKFQDALTRVLADLNDDRKDPEKPRSVKMEVIFSPNAETTVVAVLTRCDVKLAPTLARKTFADVAAGGFVQYTRDRDQPGLGFENVVPAVPMPKKGAQQ